MLRSVCMTTIPMTLSAVIAATVLGCGPSSQSFSPTERVEGRTVEGLKEAFYDLGTAERRLGTVKVWSRGAHPLDGGTVIHVGFTVDNGGAEPIVFQTAETRLDSVQTDRATLTDIAPTGDGPVTIEPATSADIELTFALPRGIEPSDVRAFRVQWTTTSADGESYVEFTPFVQDPDTAYVPVYAYYNPYFPRDYPYYYPYWRPNVRVVIVKPYPRRVIVHGDRRRR